VPVVVVPTSTL